MRPRNKVKSAVFAAFGLAAAGAVADDLNVLVGIGSSQYLTRTDSPVTPGVDYVTQVTGLEPDESVVSIDSLDGLGYTYALTQKRLYRIHPFNGQATAVGPRFVADPIFGPSYDVDLEVNPANGVGFVRRRSGASGISTTIDTATGTLTQIRDAQGKPPTFAYAEGDPGFGTKPDIAGIACAGGIVGPNAWTMFGVDRSRGVIVRIGSIGGLQSATDDRTSLTTGAAIIGVPDVANAASLEIGHTGLAYLVTPGLDAGVFEIDLSTGAATLKRSLGLLGALAHDAAVFPSLHPLPPVALDVTKAVVRYDFRPARANSGSMVVEGTLPYPEGGLSGRVIQVDFDGVVREFTTDARGRAKSGNDTFRFVGKLHAGAIRYAISIRKAGLVGVAGVSADTATSPRAMTLDLFLERDPNLFLEHSVFRTRLDVDYFALGRRGIAKRP